MSIKMWKNISDTSKMSQRLQGDTKMNTCRTPSMMILKPLKHNSAKLAVYTNTN